MAATARIRFIMMMLRKIISKNKITSLFIIYLIARFIMIKLYRKYSKMPPGDVGYPIFGSFFSVATKGHQFYIDIVRQNVHNKICTIPMGQLPMICINDVKLMRDILNNEAVQYRPKNMFQLTVATQLSLHEGGSEWKQRRKMFQSHLITMLNKTFVNKNIKLLLNQFLIPKLNALSINNNLWFCHTDLRHITFNINYCCIFGNFLKKTDESFINYDKHFELYLHYAQIYMFLYLVFGEKITVFVRKHLINDKVDYYMKKNLEKGKKWAMNAHLKYDENNLQTYYDYCYYELSQQFSNDEKPKYDDIISDKVLADFDVALEAGTDTSAATLEYCIAIAAKYVYIQDEIYEELLENVCDFHENEQEFNVLNKVQKLHKLRAFVFEVLRLIPVVPNNVFRQIRKRDGLKIKTDDGKEYVLPNGSVIITNIIGMQYNEKLWKNPDEFDINRWLDDNGKFNKKQNPFIMNFSFGLRDCPGHTLALKTIYLVIAILFSKYRFYYDEPEKVQINMKLDFVLHVHPPIGCKVETR
eukprot:102584_1